MRVLLVSSTITPVPADSQWVHDRLVGQGHTVTDIAQGSAAPADLNTAYDLVILGPAATAGATITKYETATIGVFSLKAEPHTLYSTATTSSGGSATTDAYVLPAANGDPIVGALTGTITTTTVASAFSYYTDTTLGAGVVTVLAISSTLTTRIVGSRIETGGLLTDGSAVSSRRVLLNLQPGYANLNATGRALFDNAVTWASTGNRFPAANAGPDQSVDPGATVTLDATGSTDPDVGDTLTYAWTQTSGTAVGLSSSTAAQPTFTAPSDVNGATLVFHLVVTDNHGASSADDVTVNVAPVAYKAMRVAGATVRKRYRVKSGGVLV